MVAFRRETSVKLDKVASLEKALIIEEQHLTAARKSADLAEARLQALHDLPLMQYTKWMRDLHLRQMRLASILDKGTCLQIPLEEDRYASLYARQEIINQDLPENDHSTLLAATVGLDDTMIRGWLRVTVKLPDPVDGSECILEQLSRYKTPSGPAMPMHRIAGHIYRATFRVHVHTKYISISNLEAQPIGRLDQGAVHPDEQGKAEEERQA
ncbi:MAG: hypothetical protein ACYDGY_11085, partial [Acidimicrobiales bacterium]